MKNLIKTILIFIVTNLILYKTTFGQNNLTVFGSQIVIDKPMVSSEFPSGYPASIGSTSLKKCSAIGLGRADIQEIYNAVSSSLNIPISPEGIPVMAGFFTSVSDGNQLQIVKEKTHGLCFAFHDESNLMLYYFEDNGNGKYEWVENLTTKIFSISDDLFISLQYCRFNPGSFPDKSTVYSFVCDSAGIVGDPDNSDLYVELSKDYKRQTGLFSLGMADSAILISCERPNSEYENCGGACMTFLPNSSCVMVANWDGFFVYTCQTDFGHCAAGAIDRRRRDEGLEFGVPIEFKMMRDFRDNFMTEYCESKQYIGFYYTFSKFAKMDIAMLWKYAAVLPELYSAMKNLTDESTDNVVITPELKEKVMEILHGHEDVEDPYFQSILVDVERDLEIYTGLRRSEIIAMLTPGEDCNTGRKPKPGDINSNRYFATVYASTNMDEIIVSYSVSGGRISFELFNSAAMLVTSVKNEKPSDKLSIATSGLQPGIYYYRINSDAGYEKIGKIVLVR